MNRKRQVILPLFTQIEENSGRLQMETLLLQMMNSLSYGFLLFIITCGISIVFGILGVLNLAHGSLYLLGSYIGYSLIMQAGLPFWVAILAVPLIIAAIGYITEIAILRPTYKLGHLSQVLLTFGLVYIFHDLFTIVWGKDVLSVNPPEALSSSVEMLGSLIPAYRLALIVIGGTIVFLLVCPGKNKMGSGCSCWSFR